MEPNSEWGGGNNNNNSNTSSSGSSGSSSGSNSTMDVLRFYKTNIVMSALACFY